MALLDTNPRVTTRVVRTYIGRVGGSRAYREDSEKLCEWACDSTGGETTHEGTYGGSGYELQEYWADVAHGRRYGKWIERYLKPGTSWTWTP